MVCNMYGPSGTSHRRVAIWLFLCALMVVLMVVVGGLTRLTESGLSIVEWKPISGIVPPMSEQDWQSEFTAYQQSPEFILRNHDFTLTEFKEIFWLEFVHRLLGRVTGLVFLLPFLLGMVCGAFSKRERVGLSVIAVLFALQGLMGWYMVQSGLVNVPMVSPLRLAAHLGLAVVIFLGLLHFGTLRWFARHVASDHRVKYPKKEPIVCCVQFLILLVVLQMMSGALMAGLDAGMSYNSFPLMEGKWLPHGVWLEDLGISNLYHNVATVQFVHRNLAVLVVFFGVYFALLVAQRSDDSTHRNIATLLVILLILQFSLGVLTLLHMVPIALASLHQLGAMILLTILLYLRNYMLYSVPSVLQTNAG